MRATRIGVVALVLFVGLGASPASGAAQARRVLVLSLPGVTWDDMRAGHLPALEEFMADGAVADLAPRSVVQTSSPSDAYLTISGGTRAIGTRPERDAPPGTGVGDGVVLEADAPYEGQTAAEVYERRMGADATGVAFALGWPALERVNRSQPYDVELGLLARTLEADGRSVAAIANADGVEGSGERYHRDAALALVDGAGRLSAGDVGDDLLVEDDASPFGVRLDRRAVERSFDEHWAAAEQSGGVVLVEASDLARAIRYQSLVAADRRDALKRAALRHTDDLVAALLDGVDPERDAVMIVAPYLEPRTRGLTVAGLRGPGIGRGLLRSASTQRSGIVTLVDVAPTILTTLGIARPDAMEGRSFEVVRSGDTIEERTMTLVDIDEKSIFRENLLFPTTLVLVLVFGGVAAATVAAVAGRWSERARSTIAFVALVDIAGLPASYLARGFPLEDLGVVGYWILLVVLAVAIAVAASLLGRRARAPAVALTAVLAFGVAVLVADVMTGSRLHLSAAFGYSPTGNSRLYGISNYSFGQLAAASCLLAAFVAWRWPSRRGKAVAIGFLGAILVVLGVPVWGSDVGGIIAFTPTILVFIALLLGIRPNLRLLVVVGALTVLAVAAFGFIDLARPPSQRAHLGRLFERVGNEGIQPLLSIMERKLLANLRVTTSSFWVAALPIGVALWAFLRRWHDRPLAKVESAIPTLHAGLVAGVVAAVLGSIVNDSGAIVGGVATLVLGASSAHLVLHHDGS